MGPGRAALGQGEAARGAEPSDEGQRRLPADARFALDVRPDLILIGQEEPFHLVVVYCQARAVCPATRALLLDAPVPLAARRQLPLVGPVQSEEHALAILVAAPLVETWVGERIKAAKAFANQHDGVREPVSGKVYKVRPQKRETPRLDVEGALETLRSVLPHAVLNAAVKTTLKTSFDALGKSLRAAKVQGAKDLERQARDALRRAGALKVTEFKQHEWKEEINT